MEQMCDVDAVWWDLYVRIENLYYVCSVVSIN